jgi:hypothetical protein
MNNDSVLLRQVHPHFIPNGELSSQAFFPFPKDKMELSVYDGDRISAADSHRHYTEILKFESDSVWGVTCAEVSMVGLSGKAAPLPEFPSHSIIDFTEASEKTHRKLAKKLKAFALARGCCYRPK